MQSVSVTNMKNIDLATVDRDALVDIRDVKVNTALPKRERAIDFIRQIRNPYCYKHGKYVVRSDSPTRRCRWRNALRGISAPSADILDRTGRNP